MCLSDINPWQKIRLCVLFDFSLACEGGGIIKSYFIHNLQSKSSSSSSNSLLTQGEKEYYEKQFATLKSFEEVDAIESCDGVDEDEFEENVMQERAMKVSNYAKVLLLAFKMLETVLETVFEAMNAAEKLQPQLTSYKNSCQRPSVTPRYFHVLPVGPVGSIVT